MTTHLYSDGVVQSRWKPFPGKLWLRNYWEHIVGGEQELERIRHYIANNPMKWGIDSLSGRHAAEYGRL